MWFKTFEIWYQLRFTAQKLAIYHKPWSQSDHGFFICPPQHLSSFAPLLLCNLAAQLLPLFSPALAKLTKSQTAKTLPSALLINAQKLCPHFTLTLLGAIYYLDFTIAQVRNLVVAIAYKCPCRWSVGSHACRHLEALLLNFLWSLLGFELREAKGG